MTGKSITTIIFDVDDTLYDRSLGFTEYRNTTLVADYMMKYLNFKDPEEALALRSEYFKMYHSTSKALQVAEKDGRFPPPDPTKPVKNPRFDPKDLAEYWAENVKLELIERQDTLLNDLQQSSLKLVAFSNGPRAYVKRVLEAMGLFEVFGEERLFTVEDTLPYCKPEKEAFEMILKKIGSDFSECVMLEDSMKNIRACKELGMGTVLITGKGRMKSSQEDIANDVASGNHETPMAEDPAVDLAMETAGQLRNLAPGLWKAPATFP